MPKDEIKPQADQFKEIAQTLPHFSTGERGHGLRAVMNILLDLSSSTALDTTNPETLDALNWLANQGLTALQQVEMDVSSAREIALENSRRSAEVEAA